MDNQYLSTEELSSILTRFKESDFLFFIIITIGLVFGGLTIFLRIFHRSHPQKPKEHNIKSPIIRLLSGTIILTFVFMSIGFLLLHAKHVFLDDHLSLFQMSSLTWTQSATYYKQHLLLVFCLSLILALIITFWINQKTGMTTTTTTTTSPRLRYVPPSVWKKHLQIMMNASNDNDDDDDDDNDDDPCNPSVDN